MKKVLIPLLSALLIISCQKQTLESIPDENNIKKERVAQNDANAKIDVCHNTGNDTWVTINISINALPAHLAHGDIVPDADGDGYTKVNPCAIGDQDDCDDDNAAINPGATEICDNNIDDNWNGQIDENCIPSVAICDQVWMLKNLDVEQYRDGSTIPQAATDAEWQAAGIAHTGAWCYYENNNANGTTYGKLYNLFAVEDPRGLAPAGWHVPSFAEWTTLIDCINSIEPVGNVGGKMKEVGTTHWSSPNTDATNASGFTGLPGGARFSTNGFSPSPFLGINADGRWWTTTRIDPVTFCRTTSITFDLGIVLRPRNHPECGISVRCVKD